MENKLEQLTQKLREEGLERGKAEAEQLLNDAHEKAAKIVAEAEAKAAKISDDAKKAAEELAKNTANDVRMASEQTLSMLRKQISELVVCGVVDAKVSEAWASGDFVKNLIVEAVKSWNKAGEEDVNVVVNDALVADVKAVIAENFKKGVEVKADSRVKVPFRIEPKEGGYYVSFTDGDFAELLKQTLRAKVFEFLFQK